MIEITTYRNAYDTRGEPRTFESFAALAAWLVTECNVEHATSDKRDLPAWIPARVRPGVARGSKAVEAITVMVIDVDRVSDGALSVEAITRAAGCEIELFWYASPSDPNPDGSRRVRIVAPLSREIAPEDARRLRRQFAYAIGLAPDCGVCAADTAAQMFFVGRLAGAPDREWSYQHASDWRAFQAAREALA